MFNLKIRPYEEKDLSEIEGLVNALYKEYKESDAFDDDLLDIEVYRQIYLKEPKYKIFVAEKDDKIVGYILGEKISKDLYDVVIHYIENRYRRQGIASKLKEEILKYAKSLGCKKIRSLVRSDNVASVQLNKKAGWEIERSWHRFIKRLD